MKIKKTEMCFIHYATFGVAKTTTDQLPTLSPVKKVGKCDDKDAVFSDE
jgi:hypothetical protein